MGDTHWGLGIRFIFICIVLVIVSQKCVGGGNLTTASCSEQERLALLKFKQSVIDEHGMLSSWRVGSDCCRWERVSCDDSTGRVVSLHLRRNFKVQYYLEDHAGLLDEYDVHGLEEEYYLFSDGLNSCLTELMNLKHLDLSGNDFQESRIPEFIGSFKQLRYLNLSYAGFGGKIPHQIGNLSDLVVLDLGSSPTPSSSQGLMIDDNISWIFGLSKLEHLDLSGLNLSRTQNLHKLLYTIPSLFTLSLSRCGVSMSQLGSHHLNSSRELASIKRLHLSQNDFRYQLPGLILNMTSLVFLDLSENTLKCNVFMWRLLLDRIPTKVALRRRNIFHGECSCTFCSDEEESAEHIMTSCGLATVMWQNIASWVHLPPIYFFSIKDIVEVVSGSGWAKKKKEILYGIFMVACWRLWKARNERLFGKKNRSVAEIVADVKSMSYLWFCSRGKSEGVDWKGWKSFSFDVM